MLRLIGVLLLIPLLDMLLLVALATSALVGWQVLVLLVVLSALVGMLLVRAEGRHTLRKIQRKLADGELPTDELVDGALLIVAGSMLLTPGLVTDGIGFLIVFPITRYPIRVAVKKWVVVPYADSKTGGFTSGNVYIGGFPGDGTPGEGGATGGPETGGSSDGETFDLGEDAYDVDFDDKD